MKAIVKTKEGYDNIEVLDIEEPIAKEDKIKIKVDYSGICGSDIHSFKGEYANLKGPVVLGHEFAGIVVEVGEKVKNVKVGDRVTSETTFATCNECIYCKTKDYNLCGNRKGIGTRVNGSFAEYVLSREESIHILPENVSTLEAAFTEPLACCCHAALEKTSINEDDTVLIIGPGPIGILLAQVIKSRDAKIIMSGVKKDMPRLELARELGVDIVVNVEEENLEDVVMKETKGNGVTKVFDCSGFMPAVNQALRLIQKKGTFVQVGIFAKKLNEMDQDAIIQREINYIGSRSQKPSSWELALDLLSSKKVNVEKLITNMVYLDDFKEGMQSLISGKEIKVIVKSFK